MFNVPLTHKENKFNFVFDSPFYRELHTIVFNKIKTEVDYSKHGWYTKTELAAHIWNTYISQLLRDEEKVPLSRYTLGL